MTAKANLRRAEAIQRFMTRTCRPSDRVAFVVVVLDLDGDDGPLIVSAFEKPTDAATVLRAVAEQMDPPGSVPAVEEVKPS